MRKRPPALIWLVVAAACGGPSLAPPTPTGTTCDSPDPMTFAYSLVDTPSCVGTSEQCNFGKTFMDAYCINCHQEPLTRSQRNGAPLLHDFDTLTGVVKTSNHIDEQAGFGPDAHNTLMPGAGTGGRCPSEPGGLLDEACPEPTDDERTNLALWIACEKDRPH